MSVKQPQTIAAAFAILTLFVASASGQQSGTDIPVFAAENVIFGTSVVTNDASILKATYKQEIGGDLKLPTIDLPDIPIPKVPDFVMPETKVPKVPDFQLPEIKDLDVQKPPQPTARQASYPTRQDSLFGGSNQRLVDENGYFIQATNGGLWSDATRWSEATRPAPGPVQLPAVENPISESEIPGPPPKLPTDAEYQEYMRQNVVTDAMDGNYQPTYRRTPGLSKFRLRVGFEALIWERGTPDDDVFASDDNGLEWSFNDFDFTEGTPRYFIQYMGDDQSGFEFTFFDFNSFAGSIAAQGTNVVPLFFQGSPAQLGDNFALNYTSRLKNIELNWWIRLNDYKRRGWGFRHINLDENYNVITGGAGNDGLFSRTNNDLYGIQRMWERRRPAANRLDLIGGIDLGLYLGRNNIDVDTLNLDDSSEGKNLAGTFGFNFGVEYLVANHVTLRFGYEGLALMGVALGSTNSLNQRVVNGLDEPELGGIFFGGFNIGAIAAF